MTTSDAGIILPLTTTCDKRLDPRLGVTGGDLTVCSTLMQGLNFSLAIIVLIH